MKVYVETLPKSCKDCFFCEHIEEDIDGKGRDEVACYFEGFLNNVLLGDTFNAKHCQHLLSLSDYTKQVRKEVCEEIKSKLVYYAVSILDEAGKVKENVWGISKKDIDNVLDKMQDLEKEK